MSLARLNLKPIYTKCMLRFHDQDYKCRCFVETQLNTNEHVYDWSALSLYQEYTNTFSDVEQFYYSASGLATSRLSIPSAPSGVLSSSFCFQCRKLSYRSMGWCCHVGSYQHIGLNSFLAKYLNETHFNMYAETSKRQECSSCKNSHPHLLILLLIDKF